MFSVSVFQDLNPIQESKKLSLIELILSGGLGGQIIIGILFVLLILGIYIYFERLFNIRSALKIESEFMEQINHYVKTGNLSQAKKICEVENIPVARLIGRGISKVGKPLDDISKTIENAGKLEIYNLEKNISILATISGIAPMIGFLGTVIGMIISIFEISNSGGNIDMKLLSGGLYTAMTTTVGGLIVGIIAYIFYNHLVNKINKLVYQMELVTFEFLELLNQPLEK